MIYAIAVVIVLIADQAVKFWTTRNIVLNAVSADCKELIPGFIRMTNVHNSGAAFSILQNSRWLLVVITIVFVIVIVVLINQEIIRTKFGRWTAVLVLAGALGNFIDRVLYGYVVDMFEFEFFSFPIFNLADIFITICGILFIIHVIFYREPAAEHTDSGERPARSRARKLAEDVGCDEGGNSAASAGKMPLASDTDSLQDWGLGDAVEEKTAPHIDTGKPDVDCKSPVAKGLNVDDYLTYEPTVSNRYRKTGDEMQPKAQSHEVGGGEGFTLEDILSEFGDDN